MPLRNPINKIGIHTLIPTSGVDENGIERFRFQNKKLLKFPYLDK
jgi:hypothetical protein